MLPTVAEELENELVAANDEPALMDGPGNGIDPEELDASPEAAKRRIVEQARRAAVRESLERMTLLFKIPNPGFLWSRPQTLFFGKLTALTSKLVGHSPRLF